MKRTIVLFAAAALAVAWVPLGTQPAAAGTGDPIFSTDFEDGVHVFDPGAWGMVPLADGHDGAGLRSVIPIGEHWGSGGHFGFADNGLPEPDELYWRYYVKFPTGFYIEPPARGKLPGVGGLYTYNCLGGRASTPEEPCWSARMLFSRTYPRAGQPGYPDGPDDKTLIGFYAYHLDGPDNRGDIWTWDPTVATLDHGTWYCVEGHVGMNTPGVHDGVLEGWVDGTAAFSRTDLAFRRAAETSLHVKSFWFDVYYGGGDTPIVDDEIHFDSLAFGPSRIGCDDGAVFTPPFRDDDASAFAADIAWLADRGITSGCNPPVNDRYCPDVYVTRGQMAAFLVRALGLTDRLDDQFTDDDGSVFEADIERLAAAGVTRGCNPPINDRFCPDARVSRGQMAAFLVRALGYVEDGGGDLFRDDDDSVFSHDIDRLGIAGVTRGCNPPTNDLYCPGGYVTRGQMAAFLHRALE